MGSLMGGWDSPVSDAKSAKYKRNKSLTKEEIDAYWNMKKKIQEEHLQALSPRDHHQVEAVMGRSMSLPAEDEMEMEMEKKMMKKKEEEGWWRRSNLAFLNEPPVMEQPSKSYAAQFHVASSANHNHNSTTTTNALISTN